MATKAKVPPEILAVHFPKSVVRYSGRLLPKRVVIGTVPEPLMPLYMPCKNVVTAANKAIQQHWWKPLLALAIIACVAYLIKWNPSASADKRRIGLGTFHDPKPPTTPPPPLY